MELTNVLRYLTDRSGNTNSTKESDSGLSDSFHSQLAELMQQGGASVSIKHVEVTGSVNSSTGVISAEHQSLSDLTERINYLLDLMFVRNGIPKDPPVEIEFSYTRTEVTVRGDRSDIEQISRLINEDSELSELIKSAMALASQMINMAESLRFQKEYRESPDQEEIVNRYAYLFQEERHYHHASMQYGSGLNILSDGKIYI